MSVFATAHIWVAELAELRALCRADSRRARRSESGGEGCREGYEERKWLPFLPIIEMAVAGSSRFGRNRGFGV
jgi:hypothetical protein